jgi:hypothetical protein
MNIRLNCIKKSSFKEGKGKREEAEKGLEDGRGERRDRKGGKQGERKRNCIVKVYIVYRQL